MSFNYFDVSIINPLTWPRRLINNIAAVGHDINEGIWFGKKPLRDSVIGMTFSPGFDLFHWAIMIDGWLYEYKSDGSYRITQDKSYINKFKWVKLPGKSIKSHIELYEKCDRSIQPYFLLLTESTMNCQTFVTELYTYATNISVLKCKTRIMFASGTILW